MGKLLGFNIKVNNKELVKLTKDILETINFHKKSDKQVYKLHIEVILTNLLRCTKKEPLYYVRDKNGFTKIKRYNQKQLKVMTTIKVIDILEEFGLLTNTIGVAAKNKGNRMPSYIQPTDLFLDTFSNVDTLAESVEEQFLDKEECLILRDEHKQLMAYRDDHYTRTARAVVVGLNAVNSRFEFKKGDGTVITNHFCRIYNESFDKGGRFYRGSILQLNNKDNNERLKVTCNNEPMIEIDYSNLHILLLTILEGFQYNPEIDLYNKCIPSEWINDHTRKVVKLSTNIMLNAKTKRSASAAIKGVLDEYVTISPESFPPKIKAKVVMDWIYEGHSNLSKYFCNIDSTGLLLMRMDSDMANHVLSCFVSEERPILPIHDSFLARRSDKYSLIPAMVEAIKLVTGRDDIQVPLEASWWEEGMGVVKEKIIK